MELPAPLAAALERLVVTGEVEAVQLADGAQRALRPSRSLVAVWLPLVNNRELRKLGARIAPEHRRGRACLAAAGNYVAGRPGPALRDDGLVRRELAGRAEQLRLVSERAAAAGTGSAFVELEEAASLRAQVGEFAAARACWARAGSARVAAATLSLRTHDAGRSTLAAMEDAVLSHNADLQARVLAVSPAEEALAAWRLAWQRTLRGLLVHDDSAVASGADDLDECDARKRRESTDIAIGVAARALIAADSESFTDALMRTLDQHVRYLRHGSWRGDASPIRSVMALRILGQRRGIELRHNLFFRDVTMTLRCTDEWQGEPVHRHRVQGAVDLAPTE